MSSPVRWNRLFRASVACALLGMAMSADLAAARPYTVVSCDAGLGTALSAEAWVPQTTIPGSSYAVCPSTGGENTGISDRITRATGAGLNFSAHNFTAPAGTRITGLRWGGRFARGNCAWGALVQAFPSGAAPVGRATEHGLRCVRARRAERSAGRGRTRRDDAPPADRGLRRDRMPAGSDDAHDGVGGDDRRSDAAERVGERGAG